LVFGLLEVMAESLVPWPPFIYCLGSTGTTETTTKTLGQHRRIQGPDLKPWPFEFESCPTILGVCCTVLDAGIPVIIRLLFWRCPVKLTVMFVSFYYPYTGLRCWSISPIT
jgi:hypothetical protein